jgi:hypothetical protein
MVTFLIEELMSFSVWAKENVTGQNISTMNGIIFFMAVNL